MNSNQEAAVWHRVFAAAEPGLPSELRQTDEGLTPQQVTELLQQSRRAAHTYRALAQRSGKAPGRYLLQLARAQRRHCRQLEAVWYLMTGQRADPDRANLPCEASIGEALRRCYGAATERAARYTKLAETAGSFSELFRCMGQEEARHSRIILELLQQYL